MIGQRLLLKKSTENTDPNTIPPPKTNGNFRGYVKCDITPGREVVPTEFQECVRETPVPPAGVLVLDVNGGGGHLLRGCSFSKGRKRLCSVTTVKSYVTVILTVLGWISNDYAAKILPSALFRFRKHPSLRSARKQCRQGTLQIFVVFAVFWRFFDKCLW